MMMSFRERALGKIWLGDRAMSRCLSYYDLITVSALIGNQVNERESSIILYIKSMLLQGYMSACRGFENENRADPTVF